MNAVESYLSSLPEDRQPAVRTLRDLVLSRLPAGYEEAFDYGMITYQVPLSLKADTYNGKPLQYAGLASQKNHMALYLTPLYIDPTAAVEFEERYRATGKRYDVGKSCVRFRDIDNLPLDVVAAFIDRWTPDQFVRLYERSRGG